MISYYLEGRDDVGGRNNVLLATGSRLHAKAKQQEVQKLESSEFLKYKKLFATVTKLCVELYNLKSGCDVCSKNSGQFLHVQPPQPWGDDEVHHGDHAVQLRLVDGDPGVDGVLTLLGLDSIVNTPDNVVRNLFIQVPSYVLRKSCQ